MKSMRGNLKKVATGAGHYEELLARCKNLKPIRTAVVYPCEATALAGAFQAAEQRLIEPCLVGPASAIAATAAEAGITLGEIEIVDVPDSTSAAEKGVALVREGKAEILIDNAISSKAAGIKGIHSPVAGDADILLAPDLEAGNILAKQLIFLANADSAGMVLGARVPVILTSRADSVRSRIASCAVAMLVAHAAHVRS